MHNHDPQVEQCGKLAIAYSIAQAESNSELKEALDTNTNTLDFTLLKNRWYDPFSRILFEGISKNNINKIGKNISIITFNYDRCIEHYIHYAIKQLYNVNNAKANEVTSQIEIIHPYGYLGKLAPNPAMADQNLIPFGECDEWLDIGGIARRIRTYSESVKGNNTVQRMKKAVGDAETIVFLGFSFLPQNMELLKSPISGVKRIFATGVGVSSQEVEEVKARLVSMYRNTQNKEKLVHIEVGATCNELFNLHWRNLSER